MAAWNGGLYASLVLVLLLIAWLATVTLLRVLPPRALPRGTAPDRQEDASRAMLRAMLDHAPMPLLAVEKNGTVHALNRTARKLFGTDGRLPAPPAELADDRPRLRFGGRSFRIDRMRVQGTGEARIVLALVDIEAEERMAEARATRELLEVLSHEVMNALTPVASLSESALAHAREDAASIGPLREMLGTMARRTNGLLTFTRAYRELARLPEPELAPASLPLLFDDLARMFRTKWGESVVLWCTPPAEATVVVDREQISQALWALLHNAAEAALDGVAERPTVTLSAQVGESLGLQVADNGPGVPVDQRERIFRPFMTTKPQGNGIGLSLAAQIVHAHGGELVLIEEHAPGACFLITLYAARASAPTNGAVQDHSR